jgi:hypothetical protein
MAERTDLHADPHPGESMVGPHGAGDDHGADGGHDDHAHGAASLGRVDVMAWGAAAVGVILGLLVVLALVQAQG